MTSAKAPILVRGLTMAYGSIVMQRKLALFGLAGFEAFYPSEIGGCNSAPA